MMMKFFIQLCILSFVVSYAESSGGEHSWDYWTGYGPGNWSKYYPKCNGTRQSPINIETSKSKCDENLGNITFRNYGKPTAVNFTATNNGHSFGVGFSGYTSETVPWISGKGLPGKFKLLALHFHWGKYNNKGSEHHLNNKSYGCELHMVHINTKYGTFTKAKKNPDGLAVLGIFIDVGEKNDVFDNFLNLSMYNVTYPNMSAQVESFDLMSLLPESKNNFYRYNGSLTTPSCDESVTWTVFAHAINISQQQLNEFRKLMYLDGDKMYRPLQDTHRPPQPLYGRVVKRNCLTSHPTTTAIAPTAIAPTATAPTTPTTSTVTKTSDSNGIHGNIMLVIISLFLVVMPFLKI